MASDIKNHKMEKEAGEAVGKSLSELIQKIEQSIPDFLPDDKELTKYQYPQNLPRPAKLLKTTILNAQETERLHVLEARVLRYRLKKIKAERPGDQKMIDRYEKRIALHESHVCSQTNFSFIDHLWIGENAAAQFIARPNVKLYLKYMTHLSAAKRQNIHSQIASASAEILKKMDDPKITSRVKNFYEAVNRLVAQLKAEGKEYLLSCLAKIKELVPEAADSLEFFDDRERFAKYRLELFSPTDLLLLATDTIIGAGLVLDPEDYDGVYALEAAILWHKYIEAKSNLEKSKKLNTSKADVSLQEYSHANSTLGKRGFRQLLEEIIDEPERLSEEAEEIDENFRRFMDAVFNLDEVNLESILERINKYSEYFHQTYKYCILLAGIVNRILDKSFLEPRIIFFFRFEADVILKIDRSAYSRAYLDNPDLLKAARKIEKPTYLRIKPPKSQGMNSFNALLQRFIEQGEKTCESIPKKESRFSSPKKGNAPSVANRKLLVLEEKIQVLKKEVDASSVAGFVKSLQILPQLILEIEASIKEMIRDNGIIPSKNERQQLRVFLEECRAMRLEVFSVEHSTAPYIAPMRTEEGEKCVNQVRLNFLSSFITWKGVGDSKDHEVVRETKKQALDQLIRSGNLDAIRSQNFSQEILEAPVDGANPPIVYASMCGYGHIVQYLLNKGVDIYKKGENGLTAFECAKNKLLVTQDPLERSRFREVLYTIQPAQFRSELSEITKEVKEVQQADFGKFSSPLVKLQKLAALTSKKSNPDYYYCDPKTIEGIYVLRREIQQKLIRIEIGAKGENLQEFVQSYLAKVDQFIPIYLPDDKDVAGYSFPENLYRPADVLNVYENCRETLGVSLLESMLNQLRVFEVRSLRYQWQALKMNAPEQQKPIGDCEKEVEQFEARVNDQKFFSAVDHFWIGKRYFDKDKSEVQFKVKTNLKCIQHLKIARDQKEDAKVSEAATKLLDVPRIKGFASDVQRYLAGLNTKKGKYVEEFLEEKKKLIPALLVSCDERSSFDSYRNFQAQSFSPLDLLELAMMREQEGGAGLEFSIQTIDQIYAFEARVLWHKYSLALPAEKQKYLTLLIEVLDCVEDKSVLDPQIIAFFRFECEEISGEERNGYEIASLNDPDVLSNAMEKRTDIKAGLPKSKNAQDLNTLSKRFVESAENIHRALCEKHKQEDNAPEKKHIYENLSVLKDKIQASKKILLSEASMQVLGEMLKPILEIEVTIRDVIRDKSVFPAAADRMKLRKFFEECRAMRLEIMRIQHSASTSVTTLGPVQWEGSGIPKESEFKAGSPSRRHSVAEAKAVQVSAPKFSPRRQSDSSLQAPPPASGFFTSLSRFFGGDPKPPATSGASPLHGK